MKSIFARLIAATLVSLALTSVATAGPKMEIAVEDDGIFIGLPEGHAMRNAAFDRAKELGATHIRVNAWWRLDGEGKVDEDFSRHDSFFNEATRRGFVVQMTIGPIAANWSLPRPGLKPTGVTPRMEEYLDFLGKAVRHFKGRVHRFSILNEPNHPGFLLAGDPTVVEEYRNHSAKADSLPVGSAQRTKHRRAASRLFARKIFPANARWTREAWIEGTKLIRSIDPKAEVLLGELSSGRALGFIELIVKGAKKKIVADGMAIHPYQYTTRPESKRGLSRQGSGIAQAKDTQRFLRRMALRGKLATKNGKALPLFYTEFGYHKLEDRGIAQPDRQIPESKRAAWTPRAFEVAKKAGARQMLYYQLVPTHPTHAWDTSILDRAGNGNPSFHALKAWVAKQK